MTSEFPPVIKRLPLIANVRTAAALLTGFLRLATHMMVRSGILLYHTPINRLLLEFVGEKKPKVNVPSEETKDSLTERGLFGVRVSVELEEVDRKRRIERKMHSFLYDFLKIGRAHV